MDSTIIKLNNNLESPDTIHGRMKEGAHLAGYSLQRTLENLRWLLEDGRYKQLSPGYTNVNDFLRGTSDAFKLLKIDPVERQEIAKLVKEAEPAASQRAIADMVGVSNKTIGADLGEEYSPVKTKKQDEIIDLNGEYSSPTIPPDDYDPIKQARKEREKEAKEIERKEYIEQQRQDIESGVAVLPPGLFEVIVIDPPWPYGTNYDADGRRAANPYPEMSLEQIAEIELPVANDCILWLWTTHKFMRYSFALLDTWGFRDVAIVTWVKDRMGLGSWLRSQSEFCIMAVRGIPIVDLSNQTTIIYGQLREHSRKPDSFYELVDSLCIGRKLDYFSRERRPGWFSFGNDTEKF